MNYPLIFNIAKSLLLARWRQSLVAAIGVTFGIAMFVALLSFMTGLNKLLDGLFLDRTSHVRLYNEIRPSTNQPINLSKSYSNSYNFISSVKSGNARLPIYNSKAIMYSLKTDKRVRGIAPKITAQVFFNNGANDINGIVNGIDVQAERSFFSFNDYIISGNAERLKSTTNSIILGKALAKRMQVEIGDMIHLTTTKGDQQALKIVGFYQSGVSDIDKVQSYASLATSQKLLGESNDYITDIGIKLNNLEIAPAVAREYARIYNTDAEDIQTANSQFETGTRVRTIISYTVGITLLIVAGFGIYNILNMMIYEKMDSIAILKATGFSGTDVKSIFMGISISIGVFGGLLGLIIGFLLSKGINHIPFRMTALPTVKTYPINNDPAFYLIGFAFSIITTYFAGLFPARKASKVDPVTIIRGK